MVIEEQLQRGIIFGDNYTDEYVYMPASEIGLEKPLYIYESPTGREDISLDEATRLIRVRSLKPTRHPLLGIASL